MKITIALVLLVTGIVLVGCVTKNPAYTAGNTNGVPQYVPDARINQYSNAVATVAGAAAPVNPYAAITDWGIKLVFGIVGAVAGGLATSKNKNAVIDTIAAGVVKAGPVAAQAVLDHASATPTFTAVADAINSNTGANQTPTGTPKPTVT